MERGAVPLRLQPAASSYNLPFTHQPRLIMPIIDLPMLTTSALDHGITDLAVASTMWQAAS
jgi:hypothetical protein